MMDVSLQEIFNFTDADLKENRKGRLSKSQSTGLRLSALISSLLMIAFSIGAVFLFLNSRGVFWIFIAFLSVAISYGAFVKVVEYARSVSIADVEMLEGELSLLEKTNKGIRSDTRFHFIFINETRFSISRKQYKQMSDANAGVYRVYYLPELSKVVSLEMIKLSNS